MQKEMTSERGRGAARGHYGSLPLDAHVASIHIHT